VAGQALGCTAHEYSVGVSKFFIARLSASLLSPGGGDRPYWCWCQPLDLRVSIALSQGWRDLWNGAFRSQLSGGRPPCSTDNNTFIWGPSAPAPTTGRGRRGRLDRTATAQTAQSLTPRFRAIQTKRWRAGGSFSKCGSRFSAEHIRIPPALWGVSGFDRFLLQPPFFPFGEGLTPPPTPYPLPLGLGGGEGGGRHVVRASRMAQDGFKRASESSRWPPRLLKITQDPSRWLPTCSQRPQDRSKTGPTGHVASEGGPKTAPRRGQVATEPPKEAPKMPNFFKHGVSGLKMALR